MFVKEDTVCPYDPHFIMIGFYAPPYNRETYIQKIEWYNSQEVAMYGEEAVLMMNEAENEYADTGG